MSGKTYYNIFILLVCFQMIFYHTFNGYASFVFKKNNHRKTGYVCKLVNLYLFLQSIHVYPVSIWGEHWFDQLKTTLETHRLPTLTWQILNIRQWVEIANHRVIRQRNGSHHSTINPDHIQQVKHELSFLCQVLFLCHYFRCHCTCKCIDVYYFIFIRLKVIKFFTSFESK